jgi:hypothetical protein
LKRKNKSTEFETAIKRCSQLVPIIVALYYSLSLSAYAEQPSTEQEIPQPTQVIQHYAPWKHPKILYDRNDLHYRSSPTGLPVNSTRGYAGFRYGPSQSYGSPNTPEILPLHGTLSPKLQPLREAPLDVPISEQYPAKHLQSNVTCGSSSSYRQRLTLRIAIVLAQKKYNKTGQDFGLLLTISKAGKLLNLEAELPSERMTKHRRVQIDECVEEIQKIIEETEFEPLPDWFQGKSLKFKLEYRKISSAVQALLDEHQE